MQKGILLACSLATLLPVVCEASPRPLVSLTLGSDRTNVFSSKSITLIPPFQNTYEGTHHFDTETVFGLFVGAEAAFLQQWNCQLGLSYYQNSTYAEHGNVYQFSNPVFNNLTYQYQIQSRRSYVETKLSRAFRTIWHPYISAGVGEALNKSYAYIETPVNSSGVPMSQPFASHTNHAFTWFVGLGFDVDLETHLRLGAGYRFVDLGGTRLGTTPLQSFTNTISNSHLHTNEFLAQLTLID